VIVGDSDGQAVKKYTNSGVYVWTLNGPKSWDLAVGSDETIYAADTGNKQVSVISSAGTLEFSFAAAGAPCSHFSKDRGIDFDKSDGTLWITDANLGIVEHVALTNSAGIWSVSCLGQFGSLGTGANQFVQPVGVAVDANFVYIADQGTSQIKVWDKAGKYFTTYGRMGTKLGQFQRPQGIAIGPDGHLYVVEQGNERVQDISVQTS
jgi:DNA-binding beta-propeller fold protein YncE